MALTKHKLGELIYEIDRRNINMQFGIEYVRGISNTKEIMDTRAEVDKNVINKFYIINPQEFVYNPRTTRMGEKVGLAYNYTGTPLLFSFNNIAFAIREKAKGIIIADYLFLFFNRNEFDRYARINSWGSATELFSFAEMCGIEIELPPIEVQQKYVDIYNAMVANQKAYEEGLDDLKLVCDAMIDDIKRKSSYISVDRLVKEVDVRNTDYHIKDIKGINIFKNFMPSVVSVKQENLKTYKVVQKGQFAFSGMQTGRDLCIRIALHKDDEPIIISPAYIVLEMCNDDMLAEFFMLWFSRNEIDRYGWFVSDGSIRANLDIDRFYEMQIPIPDIKIQQSIVDIYNQYITRKEINEKLKVQIKDLCPILIKGSLEESLS